MNSGVEGRGREEAVVEKGAFEDRVDEEVEEVPDEEDAEAGRRAAVQEGEGEEVGGCKDGKDGEEGDDGCGVDVVHYGAG